MSENLHTYAEDTSQETSSHSHHRSRSHSSHHSGEHKSHSSGEHHSGRHKSHGSGEHHSSRHKSHSSGEHHSSEHKSHSSGEHHSSRHKSHSSGKHRSHKSRGSKKSSSSKGFFRKLLDKITPDPNKSRNKLKKVATSTKTTRHKAYTLISRRVLFSLIIGSIITYIITSSLMSEEDASIKRAGYTPSETSILKVRVTQLEMANEALRAELEKYKVLYGELIEDDSEDTEDTEDTDTSKGE